MRRQSVSRAFVSGDRSATNTKGVGNERVAKEPALHFHKRHEADYLSAARRIEVAGPLTKAAANYIAPPGPMEERGLVAGFDEGVPSGVALIGEFKDVVAGGHVRAGAPKTRSTRSQRKSCTNRSSRPNMRLRFV